MPLRDKTGPTGKGPLTGRGLGGCSPEDLKKLKDMGMINTLPKRPNDGRGGGRGPGLRIGPGRRNY